ncbi:hypothetical protein BASA81_014052 [Batrachochytrium salamandrivorans]|nr:hypothetical protein BASA81_014052 [Batrachochytrium salamandrivorans]
MEKGTGEKERLRKAEEERIRKEEEEEKRWRKEEEEKRLRKEEEEKRLRKEEEEEKRWRKEEEEKRRRKEQESQASSQHQTHEGGSSGLCISLHNELRARHGKPALIYDVNLARMAAVTASTPYLKHDYTGQNLYTGTDPSCHGAVMAWYDEIRTLSNTRSAKISSVLAHAGHFTQLISEKSIRIGLRHWKKDSL